MFPFLLPSRLFPDPIMHSGPGFPLSIDVYYVDDDVDPSEKEKVGQPSAKLHTCIVDQTHQTIRIHRKRNDKDN